MASRSYGSEPQYADREFGPVPDIVKQFVVYLYRHIRERNIPEIQSMYEVSFPKLSERYFKQGPWPEVEKVADLVDHDHVFCLLYKELYFRHLYAKTQPGLRARCESFDNYCDLFAVILQADVNMVLPVSWMWDIIDEFLYQFQSFAQYRSKLTQKSAEEIELLRQCEKVWGTLDVMHVLQALVDKSGITAELRGDGGAALAASDGYEPGRSNVTRMLGYFSLVGLLRVHSLVGDYSTALAAMAPLNPFERAHLFTPKLPSCHISLYYYASFAYLMLRRYTDAGRCLNTILSYINRIKPLHARNAAYEQMLKKNEQMYALLAISTALCPAVQKGLDEHVLAGLAEKYGDKVSRMSKGDEGPFDELFAYGCPKFVSAAPPAYDSPAAAGAFQEAYRLQLTLFLKEVRTSFGMPLLKQYLLLYSSIPLPKLATLLDVEQGALRTALMCLKTKSHCLQWNGGASATSGTFTSTGDIDFYIDVDPASGAEMVVVSDSVHTRHHAELLARHITKFDEIVRDLESPQMMAVAAQAAPMPGGALQPQAAY